MFFESLSHRSLGGSIVDLAKGTGYAAESWAHSVLCRFDNLLDLLGWPEHCSDITSFQKLSNSVRIFWDNRRVCVVVRFLVTMVVSDSFIYWFPSSCSHLLRTPIWKVCISPEGSPFHKFSELVPSGLGWLHILIQVMVIESRDLRERMRIE